MRAMANAKGWQAGLDGKLALVGGTLDNGADMALATRAGKQIETLAKPLRSCGVRSLADF